MLQSYKQLVVWRKSIVLVKATYESCARLPKHELYGLASQMQRASVSIPSNISEGYARISTKDYVRFLSIASGSAAELDTQFTIARELYPVLELEEAMSILIEVQKMLYSMIKELSKH